MEHKKWEYKTGSLDEGFKSELLFTQWLNEWGCDGWELIKLDNETIANKPALVYIFKRPILTQPE